MTINNDNKGKEMDEFEYELLNMSEEEMNRIANGDEEASARIANGEEDEG